MYTYCISHIRITYRYKTYNHISGRSTRNSARAASLARRNAIYSWCTSTAGPRAAQSARHTRRTLRVSANMKRIKVGYQRHVIQSSRFFSDTAMVATGPSLADLVALSRSHMAHGTSKTTETQPRLAASIGYGRRDRVGREKVFGEPADSGRKHLTHPPVFGGARRTAANSGADQRPTDRGQRYSRAISTRDDLQWSIRSAHAERR